MRPVKINQEGKDFLKPLSFLFVEGCNKAESLTDASRHILDGDRGCEIRSEVAIQCPEVLPTRSIIRVTMTLGFNNLNPRIPMLADLRKNVKILGTVVGEIRNLPTKVKIHKAYIGSISYNRDKNAIVILFRSPQGVQKGDELPSCGRLCTIHPNQQPS